MRAVFFGYASELDTSRAVERIIEDNFRVTYSFNFGWGDEPHPHAFDPEPDFLFNFSPAIIKPEQLAKVRVAAINFHTGPPRWPGRGSCSMALLNGDVQFGVTAHLMTEKVDAGPIVHVIYFPIVERTPKALHDVTLKHIPMLAKNVLHNLRASDWGKPQLSSRTWERTAVTKAEFDAAMEIKLEEFHRYYNPATLDDFDRKLQAFAHPTKRGPYVTIGGRRFWYSGE